MLAISTGDPVTSSGITCLFLRNCQDDAHDQIREFIRKFRLPEAEQLIDGLLAENLHDLQAHLLRKSLANAFLRARQKKNADLQFEKLADYLLDYPEQSRELLKHLPQVLVNISYVRQNVEPQAGRKIDKAIAVLETATRDNPRNVAWSSGLTTAINLKARGLLKQSRVDDVRRLYETELDRLRRRWREQMGNPDAWLRLSYLLKAAASPRVPAYQEYASQLTCERANLLAVGAMRFPDSDKLNEEYFLWRVEQASDLEATSPQAARQLLVETQADFEEFAKKRSSIKSLLETRLQIEKKLQRLERLLAKQQLPGTAAPGIIETEWLNADLKEMNTLQGDTIVLNFFSVRSDESISTLIQLNNFISNSYPDVRLIALTHEFERPFNRISSGKRASDLRDADNRQLYRQKLLENIIQPNEFEFPVGISKASERTGAAYGITVIPHTVLIDSTGVCRYVFEGPINFETIAAAIDNLRTSSSAAGQ